MTNLFFSTLLLIPFIGGLFYSWHYDKKDMVWLFPALILSLIFVNVLPWQYSALALISIISSIIFWKRIHMTVLTATSMNSAIITAFYLFNLYANTSTKLLTTIGILSVTLIAALGICAIFEEDIKKFLIYSNIIQLLFVILHLSVTKLAGESAKVGVIQILNYALAGSLLFITLSILSKDDRLPNFKNLEGLYYKNPYIGIPAVIAAASLAGLPGLNRFVFEWLLFKESFPIEPTITLFGIFAALILFVAYFKIIYILIVGAVTKREKGYISLNTYSLILALLCIILGIIPSIQFYILENFM